MTYCVIIREKKTGITITSVLDTKSHIEAIKAINEYNKEYGTFSKLLQEYPKEKYFIDIFNDETR